MADCVYRKKPPPRLFRLFLLLTAVFRADGNDRCLVAMSIFFWWNTTRRVCCWLIRFSWRTRWQRGRRENRWRPYFTKRVDSYLGLEYQISIDLYVLLCIAERRETKTSWNTQLIGRRHGRFPFLNIDTLKFISASNFRMVLSLPCHDARHTSRIKIH